MGLLALASRVFFGYTISMNEDKTGLKIVLGILGALAIIAALWRVLAYEPGNVARGSSTSKTIPAQTSGDVPVQTPQQQALLDELLSVPVQQESVSLAEQPVHPVAAQPSSWAAEPQNRASRKQNYPGRTSAHTPQRYVDTNFYTPDNKQPSSYVAPATASYATGSYAGPQVNFNSSAQDRMREERAQMLAPYLRPNRKEKEQMDAKWAKLSAAIDRAVLQALTPKSKREQNIEKYAAQNNTSHVKESGFAGPYAPVANAVAVQKNEIVKSFGSAFGSRAAAQAGSLMDNYAQELAGALNMPNATPEQKEQKVKEISKKYQKEMDKLAEKNQYDKFVADRIAKDNEQKAQLQAQYPNPQLNAKFSQIIDEAREKDLALATQHLPAEEYYKAAYANHYNTHTKLEDAVRQAGESLNALHRLDEEKAKKELDALQQQEEDGKIISVARKASKEDREGLAETLKKERNDLLGQVVKVYGEEKSQEVKQILDDYNAKMQETMQQELSPAERARRQQDLRADSNRQILRWQMDQVSEMNIPDEQKQALLEKLRQDYNNIK